MSDTPTTPPPREDDPFGKERLKYKLYSDERCQPLASKLEDMLPSKGDKKPDPAVARAAARVAIEQLIVDQDANGPLSLDDACALSLALEQSTTALANYATFDEDHAQVIARTITDIERYLTDDTLQRPLNFLLTASPGAGKSHFVECIASAVSKRGHRIKATVFNMASMSGRADLIAPLNAVRNSRIDANEPLLFLDEFDASASNYGLLLPLLWDGAINVGREDLKLGRVVIVMAGSSPALPEMVDMAKTMKQGIEVDIPTEERGGHPKMIDLLSRVNGSVIRIPSYEDSSGGKLGRSADKVAIAVSLLLRRFKKLKCVPLGMLRLVARLRFRYDVRSIAHLIDCIRPASGGHAVDLTRLTMGELNLPLSTTDDLTGSSLAYHILSNDEGGDVVAEWADCVKRDDLVPVGLMRHHSDDAVKEIRSRLYAIDERCPEARPGERRP